jgi:glycosyltransferase involved in cell wall biosynthesis
MTKTGDSRQAGEQGSALPLVSVIMPAYNTARYIREAIDSVLEQDYPCKELIVIDDGSTDGTVEVLRSYGERITLLQQRNQGSAVARNAGLAAARGEYIAFLDSDDIWLPGRLRLQVDHLMRHPDIGMVYAHWAVWTPEADGEFRPPIVENGGDGEAAPGIVPDRSGWLYNRLLFSSLLHTITVMARKDLIARVGNFDPELKRGQDYDYWLRASRLTEIHKLDRVLALYRVHGEGCAKKWPNVNYEKLVVQKALQRWGLQGPDGARTAPGAMRRRLAETCFSFGHYHYWEGSPRLAVQAFGEAIAHRPWHISSWGYLLKSLVKSIVRPAEPTVRSADAR